MGRTRGSPELSSERSGLRATGGGLFLSVCAEVLESFPQSDDRQDDFLLFSPSLHRLHGHMFQSPILITDTTLQRSEPLTPSVNPVRSPRSSANRPTTLLILDQGLQRELQDLAPAEAARSCSTCSSSSGSRPDVLSNVTSSEKSSGSRQTPSMRRRRRPAEVSQSSYA